MSIIVILFCIVMVFVQANMEAKAYNRVTGADVTWWDAMWVNLRVDTPAHEVRP